MVAALNRLPGVSAEIATTDADGQGSRLDRKVLPPDVVVHLFRRSFSEQWKFSYGLWWWLRRHVKDYDLVHVHALWSFASAAAGSAAYAAGVPYVVRPAGMLSEYTRSRGAWKKRLYWRLLERKTVFAATAFHATSTDEAKEIQAVRPGARAFVIPNGVDDAAWNIPTDPAALRRRCGSAVGDQPILLFLSRLHPKKGLSDLLLPALAKMRTRAFLAVVGGPDPHALGYEQDIRTTIDRLGLADRVALLGPVSAAERWQMFDGAAAFVLPSHSENFGIVVAEAMARGCPVIVSDAVQAAEHVIAAGAGQVVPLAVDALAAALDAELLSLSLRAEHGANGRRHAAAHLRWDKIAEQILAMYNGCVSHAGNQDISQGNSAI